MTVPAGGIVELRLRLHRPDDAGAASSGDWSGPRFDDVVAARRADADDFYGGTSYVRAGDFLRDRSLPANLHAFVALPLHATLSEHGAVVRGVSETNGDELIRLD